MTATTPTEATAWNMFKRDRRTMVVVDVVSSVQIMQADEIGFIQRWTAFISTLRKAVLPPHGGRLVKSLGDGLLLEFSVAHGAVQAALEIQRMALASPAVDRPPLELRVGVHVADVILDELDVFGHGVNLASRLAGLARPGEVIGSIDVRDLVIDGVDADIEDLGDCWLKHLDQAVPAFRFKLRNRPAAAVPHMRSATTTTGLVPMLAVLPFVSRDSTAVAFSHGDVLADQIIHRLSKLRELRVVSPMSASVFAGRTVATHEIRASLKADYAVRGSCFQSGDGLVVQAELCDPSSGAVLFSERLSAPVSALESRESPLAHDIVERVCRALLDVEADRARSSPIPNLSGYTLMLGGIALMHRFSKRDFLRAGELLEHLCDRWPRLAAPRAWHARWGMLGVMQGWSANVAEDRSRAADAAQRALELEPDSSVALTVAGSIRIGLSKDVDEGLRLYGKALEANPNDSLAWLLSGTAHAFRGEGGAATEASGYANVLSPLDPMRFMYDCHSAGAEMAAGDYASATALAERSLKGNARHLSTYRVLAISQWLGGAQDAAKATVQRLLVLDPTFSIDGYLRVSPSAAYPIGRLCADALAAAGVPAQARPH